ncbi:MAG: SpoIIE family protein phosphatase [Bacteroidales bacterium]|nr:SpoIIE family protein phosphatase [Bacteroidales bacterium]
MKSWLFFITFIFLSQVLYSQNNYELIRNPRDVTFEKYYMKDGLSYNYVRKVIQDDYGYIWISTYTGLCQFDGYRFKTYFSRTNDSTEIAGNSIRDIHEDKEGNIWVGTKSGLSLFNREKDSFTTFTPNSDKQLSNYIYKIFEDSNNRLWLFSIGKVFNFDKKTSKFINFKNDSISGRYFLEDSKGNIWIGTWNNGLKKFNYETAKFISFNLDPNESTSISNNRVTLISEDKSGYIWVGSSTWSEKNQSAINHCLNIIIDCEKSVFKQISPSINNKNMMDLGQFQSFHEDTNGDIWVGCEKGIAKYLTETERFETYLIPCENIAEFRHKSKGVFDCVKFIEDKKGNLWLQSVSKGIARFEKATKQMSHYTNDLSSPNSLSFNRIEDVFVDNNGSVWITTYGGGLNYVDANKKQFKYITYDPFNTHGLSEKFVHSFLITKSGSLLIGTMGGGLNKYTWGEKGKRDSVIVFMHNPDNPNSISGDYIYSIYEDKNNNIWIATEGMGLNKYYDKTGSFERYMASLESGISSNYVYDIFEDSVANLWITSSGGIDILDRKNGKFEQIFNFESDYSMIYEDRKGTLWLGGDEYFGKIEKSKNDSIKKYYIDTLYNIRLYDSATGKFKLKENQIWTIYEDLNNRFWVGSKYGLLLFNREKEIFNLITYDGVFQNENIRGILEDEHANLWIGTDIGISKIKFSGNEDSVKLETIHNYDITDGIHGSTVIKAWYKATNGEMYFGGPHGFVVFHPDSIKDNPFIPPVYITDIKINDKTIKSPDFSILKFALEETHQIKLSHKQNFLAFEYVALNYSNSQKNQYKYIMEGLDKNWTDAGTRRYAEYRDIKPGKYTFRVIGCNNDGLWNEEGHSMSIIIHPPWWKTTLAYIFYVIILFLIIYYYIKYRERSLRHEKEILEKKVQKRTKEIQEKNVVLKEQQEEILTANEELVQQKEEIQVINENLTQQNEEIVSQRDEIEAQRNLAIEQKDQIEVQSKSMTDSIKYAQRIQSAMLPPEAYIHELLHENFILYKPRDVVSGDFYWIKQINQYIILAAADCTGHGVPGAFMSMLGVSFLNEIVQQREITQANHVLNELRRKIKHSLRQHGKKDESKDGMDLALCAINTKTNIMQYAGAFNPLYLIKYKKGKSELTEIKADRMPVGIYPGREQSFTNHEVKLEIGDTFYIFSDGYPDQTGKNGKKFMTKSFKELLLEIQNQSMAEQKDILERRLAEWMGNEPQIDDILVMGVRIE